MKKEHMQVLHDELIKIDLKRTLASGIKFSIIWMLVFAAWFWLFWLSADTAFFATLIIVLGAAVLTPFLIILIDSIIKLIKTSKGNFKVDTDHLINGDGLVGTVGAIDADFLVNPRYTWITLCFGKYKPFKFKKRNVFYKWSAAYKMDGYSLLNSSAPGDKFYIVTLGSKTPIMVYNAKMFDYKAELEQDL